MMFGDPQLFAIKAVRDKPDTTWGPVSEKHIAGRMHVIMPGCIVGNFDEPYCWLRPPCSQMSDLVLDSLWHPIFDSLDYDKMFDVLNLVKFGADREGCIDEKQCDRMISELPFSANEIGNYTFLTNSSEAFDGWTCFLLHPPGRELVALSTRWPSKEVAASRFPIDLFQNTVNEFACWIEQQEYQFEAKA